LELEDWSQELAKAKQPLKYQSIISQSIACFSIDVFMVEEEEEEEKDKGVH
jgi:hypothetical protein